MAIDTTAQLTISAPADKIADYMFEPANDPVWIGGITEAKMLTDYPLRQGSKVQRLAKFMGKVIDYTLEVTEFKENRLMVMRSIKSPFPMIVTYGLDPIDAGTTKSSIRIQGSSKGFYKIADFLMSPMIKRNVTGDLKRLKKIMEK